MAGRYNLTCIITNSDQIMLIAWNLRLRRLFKTQYTMESERMIPLKGTLRYRRSSIPFWKTWNSMATKVSMSARRFGT